MDKSTTDPIKNLAGRSEEKATAARLDDLEDRIEDLLPVNEDAPAEWGAHTSLTMAGRWGAKLPVATPVLAHGHSSVAVKSAGKLFAFPFRVHSVRPH